MVPVKLLVTEQVNEASQKGRGVVEVLVGAPAESRKGLSKVWYVSRELLYGGDHEHSLTLATVALDLQPSVVSVVPSTEIIAAENAVGGAPKETAFRVSDALHVPALVGRSEVRVGHGKRRHQ